ncbi:DEAD/DEAH box helicase [Oceanimonas baumannii]|uniref:DEAD/DEAH box helicase n=1 Tax=Oceanimonas baumannii TaxID=129578 RepID=UPI001D185ADD|nr:DEAD/DEAH box helicase [Oceanimonas baumannii]MCC4264421.1 DEAD/DEAH box helicase [Oceanimonas baumannii]
MFLKDLFQSLIGARNTDLSELTGFTATPDSWGVNFYLPPDELSDLQNGNGNPLQKIQLIAFNMMLEQGIAEPIANGFHISAEDIAGMDDEQADILQLPPHYPGSFTSSIQGRTGQSSFRVTISVSLEGNEIPFRRKGPYLYLTSTEVYRLIPGELMGLQASEHHENLAPEQRTEAANIRLMAELQTASRSGMRINLSHFDNFDVVVPENIGVTATRLPDGSLLLCPALGDGSTPDQLEKRWAQLDKNSDNGVLRIDNRVVLLDQKKMDGIRNVLSNKRIPADQVAEFIATPTAFLDATLVNLETGFSVRVAGIGKFQHINFGSQGNGQNDWFGVDACPSPPQVLQKVIQSPEELKRFEELLKSATQQGASSLSFAGESIDITNQTVVEEQLEIIRRSFQSPASSGGSPKEPDVSKETVSVILKEADEINSSLLQKAHDSNLMRQPDWTNYARQPYPHQQEGIEWLLRLLGAASQDKPEDIYRLQGALLADDMGLGKTYMSLVAIAEYLASQCAMNKSQKPILVVAPLSLLENWEDEVDKTYNSSPFRDIVVLQSGRDLSKFRVKGAKRESVQLATLADEDGMIDEQSIRYALTIGSDAGIHRLDMDRRLVLTTYQTLRDYQFSLCRIDWGMVIFDEAQNIKNPNALQTQAAKGLKADFKLLATGTPVENSLGDFWCLMDTAQPGLLGNWEHYRDTWIKPILSADEEERDEIRAKLGEQLRKAVGVFMLRRIKEDHLKGLPTKTVCTGVEQASLLPSPRFESALTTTMKGPQLQAYDEILSGYRNQRADATDMRGAALTALTKLRSVSLHPRLDREAELYSKNAAEAQKIMMESGKLASVLRLLDSIKSKQEKVILFMMTKRLQRMLKLWLDQIYDLDAAIINGDTKAVAKNADDMTRKKLITAFEDQLGFNILIMSPVAAGVGLTVVGANHVIHLERHWNPAKEAQASDRVYRIGQTKDVFIHLPILEHPQLASFDIHLDRLLCSKLMLKDAVVTPEPVAESEMLKSMGLN